MEHYTFAKHIKKLTKIDDLSIEPADGFGFDAFWISHHDHTGRVMVRGDASDDSIINNIASLLGSAEMLPRDAGRSQIVLNRLKRAKESKVSIGVCACGCGNKTMMTQSGFAKFIQGHMKRSNHNVADDAKFIELWNAATSFDEIMAQNPKVSKHILHVKAMMLCKAGSVLQDLGQKGCNIDKIEVDIMFIEQWNASASFNEIKAKYPDVPKKSVQVKATRLRQAGFIMKNMKLVGSR